MMLSPLMSSSSSLFSRLGWALVLWIWFVQVYVEVGGVYALRNVTVPQGSPMITYRGDWETRSDSRSVGGMYRIALRSNATAEFTFTGVAVYFEAAKWPFPLRSNVSLDGRRGIILDLQDPDAPVRPRNSSATLGAKVHERGTWRNLTNGRHTLRVTVPIGDTAAVVDNFIISEEEDGVAGNPTTTTTTTSGTETSTTTTSSNSTTTTDPALATTTTGEPNAATVLSTSTIIEDIGEVTQTVVIVEVTADAESSRSGTSSSSHNIARGLAIGFGVAFGILLLAGLIGLRYYFVRRNRMKEADALLAAGGAAGRGGSTTGGQTPVPAGGSARNSAMAQRRHSYDGAYAMRQPEPYEDNLVPTQYPIPTFGRAY